MEIIKNNITKLGAIAKEHRVQRLEVFGSATGINFKDESDIDFLVVFKDIPLQCYADNFFHLEDELSKLFDRKIDLIVLETIENNAFLKSINKQRNIIFDAEQN